MSPGSEDHPAILIATILRGTGSTGVETHVGEAAKEMARTGHPSEVVTAFSWGRPLQPACYGLRPLLDRAAPATSVVWHRWSHRRFLERALARRLRRGAPAVVYAQCPVSAHAALAARRSPAQRVVLAIHFNLSQADEWAERGRIPLAGRAYRDIRRLEQEVLTAVDGLVFVSGAARRDVATHVHGLDRVPTLVIPNFRSDVAHSRHRAPGASADLVTVGSLEQRKNHTFLLDVLAEAARLGRRYSLDVIGEGELRAPLTRRAHQLGLADQVRFLGRQPDPRASLPGHRLYVHAARRESFGIALVEAMAAGLPVLAGAVGGVPEVLADGRSGWIWPLDDPTGAAHLLVRTLDNPDGLARAGRAARQRYLSSYHPEQVVPRLVEFLSLAPPPVRGSADLRRAMAPAAS